MASESKGKYEPGHPNVRDVTGEYPAVFSWELSYPELALTASTPFNRHFELHRRQVGALGGASIWR